MTKIKRVLRCYQCGEILQDKNPKEKGYYNSKIFKNDIARHVAFCDECYDKIKSINNSMLAKDVDDEILTILDDAFATDAVILWAVDLFTFNGVLNEDLVNRVKKLDVVVVGTKFDLLKKHISEDNMKQFVLEQFKEAGINPIEIVILDNVKHLDMTDLFNKMNKIRRGHDVYMLGTSECGKTTLINKFLSTYKNKTKRTIHSSIYPNTSVNLLEIPLSNSASLYEMPGFSLVNTVLGKVEKDVQKLITPKKEIKITTKILKTGDALMIGSLAYFSIEKSKPTTFKFYSAEGVEVKKVPSKKVNALIINNTKTKLVKPVSKRINAYIDYDLFEYKMDNDEKKHDISISGLGWLNFTARGQIIRILVPKGCAIKETFGKIR